MFAPISVAGCVVRGGALAAIICGDTDAYRLVVLV